MASSHVPALPRFEASGLDLLRVTREVYAQAAILTSTRRLHDEHQLINPSPPLYLDGTFVRIFFAPGTSD